MKTAKSPDHFSFTKRVFWHADYAVDTFLYSAFLGKVPELEAVFRIHGLSFPTELCFLYTVARDLSTPGPIVEIGSWRGRSTAALASGCLSRKDRLVYAVDPLDAQGQSLLLSNLEAANVAHKVKSMFVSSEEAVRSWHEPISALFIDGDHSYPAVKKDYDNWKNHVAQEGLLIFHDSQMDGVGRLLSEIRSEGIFNFGGEIASITFFTRGSAPGLSAGKFTSLQRVRRIAAACSNKLKTFSGIRDRFW